MGLNTTIERFKRALSSAVSEATSSNPFDEAALRAAYCVGVQSVEQEALSLCDVDAEPEQDDDLDEAARVFCWRLCPHAQGRTPGEARACETCPLYAFTVKPFAPAESIASEAHEERISRIERQEGETE